MVTPCIWFWTTHPCNPPQYGLWVNLHFFMICMYKYCFLTVLLVFVIKCCIKMPSALPHNHYCCSLPLPVCLPHLLICTCLNSSPIANACSPSSVLCWCLLCCFFYLYELHYVFRVFMCIKHSHSIVESGWSIYEICWPIQISGDCIGYWALRWQRHSETTAISILCSKQTASLLLPMFKCSWKRTFSFLLYSHVCITIMV